MVSLPNGDTVVIGGWPDKNQLLRVTGMRSVWRTGSVTDGGHWQPWPSLNHPRATHSCIVTKYKVILTQRATAYKYVNFDFLNINIVCKACKFLKIIHSFSILIPC